MKGTMKKLIVCSIAVISLVLAGSARADTNQVFSFDAGWLLTILTTPPLSTFANLETNTLTQAGVGTAIDKLKVHATQDNSWRLATVTVGKFAARFGLVQSTAFRDAMTKEEVGIGTTIYHRPTPAKVAQVGTVVPHVASTPLSDWYLYLNAVAVADKACHGQISGADTEVHVGAGTHF